MTVVFIRHKHRLDSSRKLASRANVITDPMLAIKVLTTNSCHSLFPVIFRSTGANRTSKTGSMS